MSIWNENNIAKEGDLPEGVRVGFGEGKFGTCDENHSKHADSPFPCPARAKVTPVYATWDATFEDFERACKAEGFGAKSAKTLYEQFERYKAEVGR